MHQSRTVLPEIADNVVPAAMTFFNVRHGVAPANNAIAMLGVPADTLVTELPGTSAGPEALRHASNDVGSYNVSDDRILDRSRSEIMDLGNIRINRAEPEKTLSLLYQVVSNIFSLGSFPVIIGGDHSLTYGSVKSAAENFPDLRLVHIDAHYDATASSEHSCRINHGTYIRNLITENILAGPNILQAGMRDYQWRASGYRFVSRHEVWTMPMKDIHNAGITPLFDELQNLKDRPLYISLDIDSVDPAFAPGTGEHMPGGFYSREILAIIRELFSGKYRVVGCDLVEFNPMRDPAGCTGALAAELLAIMVDGLTRSIQVSHIGL